MPPELPPITGTSKNKTKIALGVVSVIGALLALALLWRLYGDYAESTAAKAKVESDAIKALEAKVAQAEKEKSAAEKEKADLEAKVKAENLFAQAAPGTNRVVEVKTGLETYQDMQTRTQRGISHSTRGKRGPTKVSFIRVPSSDLAFLVDEMGNPIEGERHEKTQMLLPPSLVTFSDKDQDLIYRDTVRITNSHHRIVGSNPAIANCIRDGGLIFAWAPKGWSEQEVLSREAPAQTPTEPSAPSEQKPTSAPGPTASTESKVSGL